MSRDALLKGRFSLPGQIYHVTTCTRNRTAHFHDFTNARLVVAQMRLVHERGQVESLAWVVMPDHVHWLFQLNGTQELSALIKRFKAHTSQALAKRGHLRGGVWQKGFHDHALRKEEDLRAVARYIVANPLRAGLVRRLGDYPHWDAKWL
ncbi:REP-associated tyrosine transposase [Pseudomonas indica]|uniref:REP-associated tyrosine transposase n=1 Tax=Pseudomonas indica TaxID=137658 RepID=UPI000BABDDA4|nr:transposase [Pseudomonas indica]PAU64625.1 transposase [Pseudomonas indica]